MIKEAPTLETTRLRLRHHRLEDFNNLVNLWADPKVYQFIGGKAFTEQQTWSRLLAMIGHWALLNCGFWLVEEKTSGSFVGQIGFGHHKRGISQIENVPELGWVIASHCHGKGFATEGVEAALQWGDNNFKEDKFSCIISPENKASIKVAQKFQFKEVADILYQDNRTLIYWRDRFR